MAREYKDSGIEWIGKIPKEWKIAKYKFFANSRMGETILSEDTSDEGIPIYSATQDSKIFGYINNPKLLLKKGDIVIPARGNSIGCISIVKEEIATCTQTTICSRNIHGIKSLFLYYTAWGLKDYWFRYDGSAIPQITVNQVNNNVILLPHLSEQQKIADYLDKVCGEVDEMIALQEKMIEELKAYKQSVITEAVTKGLNPNVPMKDSGIDWIGEIPEHWGTPSISYLTSISSGSTPDRNNPLYWYDGTIDWIKTGELQNNVICSSEEKVTDDALRETSIKLYPKNTILMAMYGQGKTRGMTALLGVPCTTNQACAALIIRNSSVTVKYLWKCLMAAYDAIRDKAVGTGQPNLNIELISKFIIPLPPVNEQNAIVERIDKVVPSIESLIAVKQQKIEELKEYKKSIIYEYVTGKKEVV